MNEPWAYGFNDPVVEKLKNKIADRSQTIWLLKFNLLVFIGGSSQTNLISQEISTKKIFPRENL